MVENRFLLNDGFILDSNRSSFRKREKTVYEIMHKEQIVASVSETGRAEILDAIFMPYDLYLETEDDNDIDILMNNLTNFYHWCASRVLSLD